jgi:hypothetical protein
MDQQTVGMLFGGLANCGFAEIDGGGEPRNLARAADLQPVQRLRGVSDFVRDMEILVEKTDQSV